MKKYTTGIQPCKDFNPRKEGFWNDNVHECFCKDEQGKHCDKSVSNCSNCGYDHHEGGLETCACANKDVGNGRFDPYPTL